MKDAEKIRERLEGILAEKSDCASGRVLAVRAPARSEIAGNHTDHEGGRVIAAALDRGIECLAAANSSDVARVFSQGYDPIELALDSLEPRAAERGTSAALVRGMAAQMAATGRIPAGFDLVMTSDIPAGGGLSSSAAFELAMCRAMERLWPGREVDAVEAAQMAQRVESAWFGKPCGLMDQLAISLGGLAWMDFADAQPATERLALDFSDEGYVLCLTDVGTDHSDCTDEYAAVPAEMKDVAQALGASRLCEVDESTLIACLPELRTSLGDRPLLRALHYYQEMDLVDERWRALKAREIEAFLEATRRSGASSGMFLQNVSVSGARTQDCMVALALSERLLGGRGASRIHGGGFGGSIQAFVPAEQLDGYVAGMNACFGDGACTPYTISDEGAMAQWL